MQARLNNRRREAAIDMTRASWENYRVWMIKLDRDGHNGFLQMVFMEDVGVMERPAMWCLMKNAVYGRMGVDNASLLSYIYYLPCVIWTNLL